MRLAGYRHAAARVADYYAPDGSLSVNGGAPAVGRSAITEVAQSFMTAFPDMKVVMDGVFVQGDRAVCRWTLVGTNTGPGGKGNKVRISGCDSTAYQHQLEHGFEGAR